MWARRICRNTEGVLPATGRWVCSPTNGVLLAEEAAAPGFNPLNLLLFHNFVFTAESTQDSPSSLRPPCRLGAWSSVGPGRVGTVLSISYRVCYRAGTLVVGRPRLGMGLSPWEIPFLRTGSFVLLHQPCPSQPWGVTAGGEGGKKIPSAKQGAGGMLRAGRKGDVAFLNIPPENQERQ